MTPTVDAGSYRKGQIVWAALAVALASYYVVIRLVLAQPGTPTLTDATQQRNVFFALSAAMIVLIVVFDRGIIPMQPRGGNSAAFTRNLCCWALAESIGLYGMILAFQTRRAGEAHVFLLVAAAVLFWLRPRPERFPPDA